MTSCGGCFFEMKCTYACCQPDFVSSKRVLETTRDNNLKLDATRRWKKEMIASYRASCTRLILCVGMSKYLLDAWASRERRGTLMNTNNVNLSRSSLEFHYTATRAQRRLTLCHYINLDMMTYRWNPFNFSIHLCLTRGLWLFFSQHESNIISWTNTTTTYLSHNYHCHIVSCVSVPPRRHPFVMSRASVSDIVFLFLIYSDAITCFVPSYDLDKIIMEQLATVSSPKRVDVLW